jgi:hypothetical protein
MADAPQSQIQSTNKAFGWSPISRRYVKRTGLVYRRLVMSGIIVDPEISHQLENPQTGTRPRVREKVPNNVVIRDDDGAPLAEPSHAECRANAATTASSRKIAKKIIAEHVEELEGLPPGDVDALLRRLLAVRIGHAAEPVEQKVAPAVRQSGGAARVRVAVPKKAPVRRARVADLFTTEDDATTCDDDNDD